MNRGGSRALMVLIALAIFVFAVGFIGAQSGSSAESRQNLSNSKAQLPTRPLRPSLRTGPRGTATIGPHAPNWCWDDGQNGSGSASSATIKADCTNAISGLYIVTGTPKPVTDCDPQPANCSSWHYINVNRIHTVDNSFSSECPSLSGGSTNDACFQHYPGGGQNSGNRIYPMSGCPATGNVINMNFGVTGLGGPNPSLAWWNAYIQGTDTAQPNAYNDNYDGVWEDTFKTTNLANTTGCKNSTIESTTDANLQTEESTFNNHLVHLGTVTGHNYAPGSQFTTAFNGCDDAKTNQDTGPGSSDNCVTALGLTTGGFGVEEFAVQTGTTQACVGTWPNYTQVGLTFNAQFAPFYINTASRADALGKGDVPWNEYSCSDDGNNTSGSPNGHGATIEDRMLSYVSYLFTVDNSNPTMAIMEDYLKHSTFATSADPTMFDEMKMYIRGGTTPSVPDIQAAAYTNVALGLAGCSRTGEPGSWTGSFIAEHGIADYLIGTATCRNIGGPASGKNYGVYRRCWHHFGRNGVDIGDACIFLNISNAVYNIAAGDFTGYTIGHEYRPSDFKSVEEGGTGTTTTTITLAGTPICGGGVSCDIVGGVNYGDYPADSQARLFVQ